jgi:hypothetical protein
VPGRGSSVAQRDQPHPRTSNAPAPSRKRQAVELHTACATDDPRASRSAPSHTRFAGEQVRFTRARGWRTARRPSRSGAVGILRAERRSPMEHPATASGTGRTTGGVDTILPPRPGPTLPDGVLRQSDLAALPAPVPGRAFVYRLLDPVTAEPRYVGRTRTPAIRRHGHRGRRSKKRSPNRYMASAARATWAGPGDADP